MSNSTGNESLSFTEVLRVSFLMADKDADDKGKRVKRVCKDGFDLESLATAANAEIHYRRYKNELTENINLSDSDINDINDIEEKLEL